MAYRTQTWCQADGRSRQTHPLAIWILGCLCLGSLSCSPAPTASDSIEAASSAQELPPELLTPQEPVENIAIPPGQILPVTAEVELESGQVIELEVAETPQQQALGLMHRTSLSDNRGMLFPFNPPRPVSFWMRNVEIYLDMVFVRDGVVVDIAANVPPCTTSPCPTYGPAAIAVDAVIELRGERAAELDIRVGSPLEIRPLVTESGGSVNE